MQLPIYSDVMEFEENYQNDLNNFLTSYQFIENPTVDDFHLYLFEKYQHFNFENNLPLFDFREQKGYVSVPIKIDIDTAIKIFTEQFKMFVFTISQKPKYLQKKYDILLHSEMTKYDIFSNLTEIQYKVLLEPFLRSNSWTKPFLYDLRFKEFVYKYSKVDEQLKRLVFDVKEFKNYCIGGQGVMNHICNLYFPEKTKTVPVSKKRRSTDVNFKFAMLQEMGVIKWLENNIQTNNEDRAEILQEIMGGSTETLKDYLKGKTINRDVKQKALDFLNDRRYPK